MIYSHKPQRSGRSITANTNNPPQDPPPPKTISLDISKISHILEIPDIPIKDTTPPVPEICVEKKPVIVTPKKKISKPKETPKEKPKITVKPQKETPKVSLFRRILAKLKFFRRR